MTYMSGSVRSCDVTNSHFEKNVVSEESYIHCVKGPIPYTKNPTLDEKSRITQRVYYKLNIKLTLRN